MVLRAFIVVCLCTLLLTGCGTGTADPVVMVEEDDAEMLAAQQKARDTVGEFIAALENPKPEQTFFSVKAKFEDGDAVEFMWLVDVEFVDGQFIGTIDNDPQLVSNVKAGDRSSVAPNEINDWMIVENGEMVGAYTVEVLARRQGESE